MFGDHVLLLSPLALHRYSFKASQDGRELVIVGGGLQCGLSTVLRGIGEKAWRGAVRQLAVGPLLGPARPIVAPDQGRISMYSSCYCCSAVVHSNSASVCSAWSRKDFNLGSRSKSSSSLSSSSSSSRGKLALPDVPGDGATDADADDADAGAVVQHPAIQRWGELDPKPGMVFKHQVRGRWHVLRRA